MIQDFTNYVSSDEFLNENSKIQTTEDNFDYNAFYRAYVIANDDPEKLGRVKIQIPGKHLNNYAPWAYPGCFNGFGFQTGTFILPPIGSIVFVTFEHSKDHRPIYFGGIPTKYSAGKSQSYGPFINNGDSVFINTDDLPFEYTGTEQIIYKGPTGNIIYFDSATRNNAIVIKNLFEQKFKIAREITNKDDTNNYIEMYYDENNYLRIKENSYEFKINGNDVINGGTGYKKYMTTIQGDGVTSEFVIGHDLYDYDSIIQVFDFITGENITNIKIYRLGYDAVKITFPTPPSADSYYRVIILA